MKKLSDYQGEEAIELWADLLEPISEILSDPSIAEVVQNSSKIEIVQAILKYHQTDAVTIMERVDPEPVNGLNIIVRLLALVSEIGSHPEAASFFGFAGQVQTDTESSGSVTESTGAKEK